MYKISNLVKKMLRYASAGIRAWFPERSVKSDASSSGQLSVNEQ